MTQSAVLTVERLREVLDYCPQTGAFHRKVRLAQCHRVGQRADFVVASGQLKGYRRIAIDGRRYLAHRLAWLYVHGTWPERDIDHINGDKSFNGIQNLRDVTRQVNLQNKRRAMKNSTSGLLGAHWNTLTASWRSRIQIGKKSIHLGMFSTAKQAHEAYLAAKRKYHQGCTI